MNLVAIAILSIMMLWFCFDMMLNTHQYRPSKILIYLVIYILLGYFVLFDRDNLATNRYTNGLYITKWIKLIFTSRIVFINLVGNIFLFIPLGMLLKYLKLLPLKAFLIACLIILLIESAQYLTKRGIFDLLDIALNMIGVIIGYICIKKVKTKESTNLKTNQV